MTKDAERLLQCIVKKSKEDGETSFWIDIEKIEKELNIYDQRNTLLKELNSMGMLGKPYPESDGFVYVSLTTDGLEYFDNKREMCMKDKGIIFNVNGGQVNFAQDNATINATQNNGVSGDELEKIVKSIMDNLKELDKEDADKIVDVVEMAREELVRPEPRPGRLRNCLSLITPMIAVANGIPVLADNLQKFMNFIQMYVH